MKMNKQQADALCAIIALGFVDQNLRSKDNETLYLYDSAGDKEEHDRLCALLSYRYGMNIPVMHRNAKDQTTNTKIFPFIYALPYGDQTALDGTPIAEDRQNKEIPLERKRAVAQDMAEKASPLVEAFEREAAGTEYKGAYIGGFLDFTREELSLIGPSSIYVRDHEYLEPGTLSPGTLTRDFSNYRSVTKNIKDMLKTTPLQIPPAAEPQAPSAASNYQKAVVDAGITDSVIFEGTDADLREINQNNKTIASCHGLVTSMYYHFSKELQHLNDGVCVEFSFSDGTCKSASCIPCAILAAAMGAPASQVHFGRGDYWNLPKKEIRDRYNPAMEGEWKEFVRTCYWNGCDIIKRVPSEKTPVPELTKTMCEQTQVSDKIPDMFLDALTVEGKFIDKMLACL